MTDMEISCDRWNCKVNDVELHAVRPGWLVCECGEEWKGSDRDVSRLVDECLGYDPDSFKGPEKKWERENAARRLRLGQRHRDALKYQQFYVLAGQPVPDVDIRTMAVVGRPAKVG